VHAFLERPVEVDLADLAPERRLRELTDREEEVADAVRRSLGVHHFHVEDAVHVHLDVVLRDADLLRNVGCRLLQRMAVADRVEERDQHVEAGFERRAIAPESLDDEGTLLRHHDGRSRDDKERQPRQHQKHGHCTRQHVPSDSLRPRPTFLRPRPTG